MDTQQIKSKFEYADQCLEAAKNELNRPAEDVVPFMVCRSARHSISNYLMGYLLTNGIELDEEVPVETILEKCRALNSAFNDFDLSAINFASDDEYSADFGKMEKCIVLATYAKQLAVKTPYSN